MTYPFEDIPTYSRPLADDLLRAFATFIDAITSHMSSGELVATSSAVNQTYLTLGLSVSQALDQDKDRLVSEILASRRDKG